MTARKKPAADEPVKLGKFEGREVLSTRLGVRNIGDVLAESLEADPQVFHHGDVVALVTRAVVVDVQHPNVPKTEGVARLHVIRATEATIVPDEFIAPQLDAQTERIRLHHERLAGIQRLDGTGVDPAAATSHDPASE